jgi:hypothetical protein
MKRAVSSRTCRCASTRARSPPDHEYVLSCNLELGAEATAGAQCDAVEIAGMDYFLSTAVVRSRLALQQRCPSRRCSNRIGGSQSSKVVSSPLHPSSCEPLPGWPAGMVSRPN